MTFIILIIFTFAVLRTKPEAFLVNSGKSSALSYIPILNYAFFYMCLCRCVTVCSSCEYVHMCADHRTPEVAVLACPPPCLI